MNSPARRQARKIFIALFLSLVVLRADPSGPEIMNGVKTLIQTQSASLAGRLVTGPQSVPFTLRQGGGESIYEFQNPAQTIRVSFADHASKLTGVDDPQTSVRGSVLTYDDLAMRFLYWQDIQVLETIKIRSLPCWHLRLKPPNRNFAYGLVDLWVNQQSGAFLRAVAYDWNGKVARQFEVISTQSIDGRMMLKKMRIQDLQTVGSPLSYLEIDAPSK